MRYRNPQLGAQHCFVASFGRCFPFFTMHDQLVAQQKYWLQVKKYVAKSRARVNFERQMFALLLVFHQTHNLSRNKRKNVAHQVEGFCISYFAALRRVMHKCRLCAGGQNLQTKLNMDTFFF